MDARYREIYGQLYSDFVRRPPDAPEDPNVFTYTGWWNVRGAAWDERGRSVVESAIEASAQEIGQRSLREDAKALLALNFYNLVLVPLRAGGRVDEQTLDREIGEDIPMLVRAAANSTGDPEISAHDVLDALSNNWDNLQTGRHRLWQQDT